MWAICSKCRKWGETPAEFRENIHWIYCICGSTMYLVRSRHPHDAGYRDKNKVEVTIGKRPNIDWPLR